MITPPLGTLNTAQEEPRRVPDCPQTHTLMTIVDSSLIDFKLSTADTQVSISMVGREVGEVVG